MEGNDALLDRIENMPNLDIKPLRRPVNGNMVGLTDEYNRIRYLDMKALADNLRLTKRELEDSRNNWKRDGIPLAWKVLLAFKLQSIPI